MIQEGASILDGMAACIHGHYCTESPYKEKLVISTRSNRSARPTRLLPVELHACLLPI